MTLLAVPSDAPGGFDADISGHFGHCDAFSLFRIEAGKVVETAILPAAPHDNCLAPVRQLAERGVTDIVVYGMGPRPLSGFLASGIQPFHAGDHQKVGDVVDAFLGKRLTAFGADHTCAHHGDGEDCHH
ncbi:dinitrogenase iron-molybdenum cofactor biosynthesis protein [Pleomorphomonas diazotrophica]|uniref:Dinitrogenase iron-molybdenum cofactor biosynthesis protein n=1 Tax=Pleomorphomonas diazotrophica TaxID=1166257 RepID=A0A1I4V7J1_9HYPH|nr:NifB/NifX family molybdenum-iron cluster-binding protein [Pleomorphomonas diazotrophica]PKR87383.1 dinitrogenase iron-molybdenum cofactor biosynthesis protein [Pleomorphomonas diazotrophica]SFM97131.1 Predicted Fe-Mo cluster-binding protein, NifX family [Pleomorphomonas diazotrophica]